MKYQLDKNNNSKKLIIGVSIIFCTIILIIGFTTAYFTQSGIGDIESIISSNNNQVYINYTDNKTFMLDNIIPIKKSDLNKALFNNNICVDNNGYNVCSAYMFTLESSYKETQNINISMIPTGNSFTNLKFMMYKINDLGKRDVEIITESPQLLEKNNLNPITLVENETLTSDENITYALVFYVESMTYDQTLEDAGKSFGATIKVDSLTTGTYIIESFGDECWNTELLNDGTYKLTEFYGIDNNKTITDDAGNSIENTNYGNVKEMCSPYVEKDDNTGYYSINIPSSVGGRKVSTLGNKLFTGLLAEKDGEEIIYNDNYLKINNVNIQEGITTIEDGCFDGDEYCVYGTFMYKGIDMNTGVNFNFNVNLPDSMTYIGGAAFMGMYMNKLDLSENVKVIGNSAFESNIFSTDENNPLVIPSSVVSIGEDAFVHNTSLTHIVFEGSSTEVNDNNKLSIGNFAFGYCNLTYDNPEKPLELPARIVSIGTEAFDLNGQSNFNLKYIRYYGSQEMLDSFKSSWSRLKRYYKIASEYDVEEARNYFNN